MDANRFDELVKAEAGPRRSRRRMVRGLIGVLAAGVLGSPRIPSASAAGQGSQATLKEYCTKEGGTWWKSGGRYGCMINGLASECNADGTCVAVCYERWGCDCEDLAAIIDRCVHADGKPAPGTPPITADPDQELAPVNEDEEADADEKPRKKRRHRRRRNR